MAPAMLTFLTSHNWQGKKVIPFQTHGGWPGHVIADMKKECKGATFSYEMEVRFDSTGGDCMQTPEKKVLDWIQSVKRDVMQNE